MANNDVYTYKLTDEARRRGVHSFSVDGRVYKAEKNGTVRMPAPGLLHPEAHGCVLLNVLEEQKAEAELESHKELRMDELSKSLEAMDFKALIGEATERKLDTKDKSAEKLRKAILENEADLLEAQSKAASK